MQNLRIGFKGRDLAAIELLDGFGQRSLIQFNALVPNASVAPDRFRFVAPPGFRRHRLALTAALMPHDISLIATLAAGFGLGMVLGYGAARLRFAAVGGVSAGRRGHRPLGTPALLAIWRWLGSWLKSA